MLASRAATGMFEVLAMITVSSLAVTVRSPAVMTAASGRLFRRGVLIKDGTALERLVAAAHDRGLRADAALTQQLLNDSRRRLRHEAQAEADRRGIAAKAVTPFLLERLFALTVRGESMTGVGILPGESADDANQHIDIPIATGERNTTRWGFREIIEKKGKLTSADVERIRRRLVEQVPKPKVTYRGEETAGYGDTLPFTGLKRPIRWKP